MIVESLDLGALKTKILSAKLKVLGWESALVISASEADTNFEQAASNLPEIAVVKQQGANVYDILRRKTLVITREAVEQLEARLI